MRLDTRSAEPSHGHADTSSAGGDAGKRSLTDGMSGRGGAPGGPSRVVHGAGGWTYEQHRDGTITIVDGPSAVGRRFPPGSRVNAAITREIGPFPGGDAPAAEPAAAEAPEGEAPTETPAAAGPSYFSQRDNTFGAGDGETIGANTDVRPDSECNVTTLAMQLVALGGSIEAVNAQTLELLTIEGVAGDPALLRAQPEDLILRLFQVRGAAYWKRVCAENPGFFPRMSKTQSFFDYWQSHNGWHQLAACLNWVGQEYDFVKTSRGTSRGAHDSRDGIASKDYFLATLRPRLAAGAAIMLSTRLTGGHIVLLVAVHDDGIVIHDPYGMRLTAGYVKNGTANAQRIAGEAATTVPRRLGHNPELLAAAADLAARHEPRSDWGRSNFYDYDEVVQYQIGKWNSVLDHA